MFDLYEFQNSNTTSPCKFFVAVSDDFYIQATTIDYLITITKLGPEDEMPTDDYGINKRTAANYGEVMMLRQDFMREMQDLVCMGEDIKSFDNLMEDYPELFV